MKFKILIGLETHAKLLTKSKIFSHSPNKLSKYPNSQISYFDIALPGTLPILNKKPIELAIKFGLAVKGKIMNYSYFERKNYFYPDLPKGYQITQFNYPIIKGGYIKLLSKNNKIKKINLISAHLEEDAGKLLHNIYENKTCIDFNRSGMPLLEIVTKPEISKASEAIKYLKKLRSLLIWLKICDGNMQDGSFRCDVNISIQEKNKINNNRCEIKNLNSFNYIKESINYEINRQIKLIKNKKKILRETRLYDSLKKKTKIMRYKKDYYYFYDPDLLPLRICKKLVKNIKKKLPESQDNIYKRLKKNFNINNIKLIINSKKKIKYFEQVIIDIGVKYKKVICIWIFNYLFPLFKKKKKKIIKPIQFSNLLKYIIKNIISNKIAKKIFIKICNIKFNNNNIIYKIVKKYNTNNIYNTNKLIYIIDQVLLKKKDYIKKYKLGNKKIINAIIGLIIKKTHKKVDPNLIFSIVKNKIK